MLATLPRGSGPDEVASALEEEGAVVVEGFLSDEAVDALRADFQPHLDAVPWCNAQPEDSEEFFGRRTKRLHGLLARSRRFGGVVEHPLLAALCERLLRPQCRDVRVSTGELMALGRGETDQVLHRDADSWHRFPRPRPEILVSANVALTDFTETNGATVVVPGSHRWEPDRRARPEERAQAVMRRGSALLYGGNVLHGGGTNETDEVRIGLYVGFVLSWLRPIENQLVTCGVDVIRAASPRVQELYDCTESGWNAIA